VKSNIPLGAVGCSLENREQKTKQGAENREQGDFVAPVFPGCETSRLARSRGKKFCIRRELTRAASCAK
jgi:hypothetical protein